MRYILRHEEEYLNKIRTYLKDIINDLKKYDTWKILKAITKSVTHSKSDNIEVMMNDKADEVIDKLFQSLLSRYQTGSETFMEGSDFLFDCAHLLYYKCHKKVLNMADLILILPIG